jgi:hypothetical protein
MTWGSGEDPQMNASSAFEQSFSTLAAEHSTSTRASSRLKYLDEDVEQEKSGKGEDDLFKVFSSSSSSLAPFSLAPSPPASPRPLVSPESSSSTRNKRPSLGSSMNNLMNSSLRSLNNSCSTKVVMQISAPPLASHLEMQDDGSASFGFGEDEQSYASLRTWDDESASVQTQLSKQSQPQNNDNKGKRSEHPPRESSSDFGESEINQCSKSPAMTKRKTMSEHASDADHQSKSIPPPPAPRAVSPESSPKQQHKTHMSTGWKKSSKQRSSSLLKAQTRMTKSSGKSTASKHTATSSVPAPPIPSGFVGISPLNSPRPRKKSLTSALLSSPGSKSPGGGRKKVVINTSKDEVREIAKVPPAFSHLPSSKLSHRPRRASTGSSVTNNVKKKEKATRNHKSSSAPTSPSASKKTKKRISAPELSRLPSPAADQAPKTPARSPSIETNDSEPAWKIRLNKLQETAGKINGAHTSSKKKRSSTSTVDSHGSNSIGTVSTTTSSSESTEEDQVLPALFQHLMSKSTPSTTTTSKPKSSRNNVAGEEDKDDDSSFLQGLTWTRTSSANFSDWKISVTGGLDSSYYVHRNVLAVGPRSSSFFLKEFKSGNSDSTTTLKLTMSPAGAFPEMLDYMYGGTLRIRTHNALALRYLGDSLGIKELYKEATKFVQVDLNQSNIYKYFKVAQEVGDVQVMEACIITAAHAWRGLGHREPLRKEMSWFVNLLSLKEKQMLRHLAASKKEQLPEAWTCVKCN